MHSLPKLFCFDMDGTLTRIASSWEYLSRRLGIWDGNAEHHLTAFIEGKIDYMEFCRLDAMVLKGLPSKSVYEAIAGIEIDSGVESLVKHLRERGVKLALISSGLSILADRVMQVARFDYVFANELEVSGGMMTGGVKVNVSIDDPNMTKKAIVSRIAASIGLGSSEIAAVGDNWGDHGMIEEAATKFFVNRLQDETDRAMSVFEDIIIVNNMDDIRRYYS
ncbi:MAG: Phosphoserine phosphatase [Firmicutes bacterium ADurb.Bin153]|nr:MAG: Phosphoserine phosphatase [Firmicutes bacterium ADurb.Bin153]